MRNIKTKKKLKMLAMVMTLSIPMAATAQGGLFQRGPVRESNQTATLTNQNFGHYVGCDDVTNQPFGHFVDGDDIANQAFGHFVDGDAITNQTFGTPIGNGVILLLAIGVGYATIKTKNSKSIKQNKNEEN